MIPETSNNTAVIKNVAREIAKIERYFFNLSCFNCAETILRIISVVSFSKGNVI